MFRLKICIKCLSKEKVVEAFYLKFFLFPPEFLVAVLAEAAAPLTLLPLPRLRRWAASWSGEAASTGESDSWSSGLRETFN